MHGRWTGICCRPQYGRSGTNSGEERRRSGMGVATPIFLLFYTPRTAGRRMAVCVPNLLRNEGVPDWVSRQTEKPREAQGAQGDAQGGAWRPPW